MKWLIAATLTGSTALVPAAIEAETQDRTPVKFSVVENEGFGLPIDPVILAEELRAQDLHEKQFVINQHEAGIRELRESKIRTVLDKLKGYVGKTPYVFSGASPRGWDCSGLVMWTYDQLGVELPHSASAQLSVGKHVSNPIPGDIVVWGGGYHSGIYLGEGRVLNALNPRSDTNIVDVDYLYGRVTYVRVTIP
jgi:cell wall-associated NlpC family hydrolase